MATNSKISKMAAVGSYDSVLPFKAIGLDVTVIDDENRSHVGHILNKYAADGFAAVFIEEAIFSEFNAAIEEINKVSDVCLIPVPNQSGSTGIGLQSIRTTVERAVGMDIFGVNG